MNNGPVGRWDSTQLLPPNDPLVTCVRFLPKKELYANRRQPEAFYSAKVSWSIDPSVPFRAHDCMDAACTHAVHPSVAHTHSWTTNCSFRLLGTLRSYLFYLLGIMWSRCTSVGIFAWSTQLLVSIFTLYSESLKNARTVRSFSRYSISVFECMHRSIPLVSSSTTTWSSVSCFQFDEEPDACVHWRT